MLPEMKWKAATMRRGEKSFVPLMSYLISMRTEWKSKNKKYCWLRKSENLISCWRCRIESFLALVEEFSVTKRCWCDDKQHHHYKKYSPFSQLGFNIKRKIIGKVFPRWIRNMEKSILWHLLSLKYRYLFKFIFVFRDSVSFFVRNIIFPFILSQFRSPKSSTTEISMSFSV